MSCCSRTWCGASPPTEARALLAITNDAWYGRTGAPYQFLAITALRSAETGLWTARAANTGVSGFIDARGRVRVADADLRADLARRGRAAPPGAERSTFYVRYGDVFAWCCWLGWLAHCAVGLARGRLEPV